VRDLAQKLQVIANWEHFGHGADIGVRGIGRTMAEAFEQAAIALTAVITDPTKVENGRCGSSAKQPTPRRFWWSGSMLWSTKWRSGAEVKGATYTSLFVGQKSDGAWIAQCVVDV